MYRIYRWEKGTEHERNKRRQKMLVEKKKGSQKEENWKRRKYICEARNKGQNRKNMREISTTK
jgi:hypothetical protein